MSLQLILRFKFPRTEQTRHSVHIGEFEILLLRQRRGLGFHRCGRRRRGRSYYSRSSRSLKVVCGTRKNGTSPVGSKRMKIYHRRGDSIRIMSQLLLDLIPLIDIIDRLLARDQRSNPFSGRSFIFFCVRGPFIDSV